MKNRKDRTMHVLGLMVLTSIIICSMEANVLAANIASSASATATVGGSTIKQSYFEVVGDASSIQKASNKNSVKWSDSVRVTFNKTPQSMLYIFASPEGQTEPIEMKNGQLLSFPKSIMKSSTEKVSEFMLHVEATFADKSTAVVRYTFTVDSDIADGAKATVSIGGKNVSAGSTTKPNGTDKISATISPNPVRLDYSYDSVNYFSFNNKGTIPLLTIVGTHFLTIRAVFEDDSMKTWTYTIVIEESALPVAPTPIITSAPVVTAQPTTDATGTPAITMIPTVTGAAGQTSEWAKEEVSDAEKAGLVPDSIKKTAYTKAVSRKEFCAIALRLYEELKGEKVELPRYNPFDDTQDEEVLKAYKIGITKGTSEETFSPDTLITREQMATMMSRALSKAGVDVKIDMSKVSDTFVDHLSISEYAMEPVYFMANKGIIKGMDSGMFGAQGTATIEQSLIISLRSYKVFKK